MMYKRITCFFILLLCLLLAVPSIAEESIRLSTTEVLIGIGSTVKLEYELSQEDQTGKPEKVVWSSSDAAIASVTGGTIKGVASGSAEITVTASFKDASVSTATAHIDVFTPIKSIAIEEKAFALDVGNTSEPLHVTILPENAHYQTKRFTSSDETVATVDEQGIIHALKAGKTTITVATDEPSATPQTAQVVVTVNQPVLGLSFTQNEIEIARGSELKPAITVLPDDATNPTVKWASSDKSIISIESGTLSALKVGDAIVTVTAKDGSEQQAELKIHVYSPVTSLRVSEKNQTLTMYAGESHEAIPVVVSPDTADYPEFTWISDDEEIATVDEDGTIHAHKAGKTKIKAVSLQPIADGQSAKSVSITLTVKQYVTEISAEQDVYEVGKGRQQKLIYTVLPEDASSKEVVWTTSDKTIATVSAGTVTGIAEGTAQITVQAKDGSEVLHTFDIHVFLPVTAVQLSESKLSLLVNEKSEPQAYTIAPESAIYTGVSWNSSDEAIATVDDYGVITGLKAGKATITATSTEPLDSKYTPKSASLAVTVIQKAESINLESASISIAKGSTKKLVPSIAPADTSDQTVTWVSSDPAVATVASTGVVTAKGIGTAVITCTTADGTELSASTSVTVYQQVTQVTVNPTRLVISEGNTANVSANIAPKDATDKRVTWSSSDEWIATVDSSGVVTAKHTGTCKITATAADGSEHKGSVSVVVEPKIPLDATTFTRSGYFGSYYEFAVTFKNLTQTRGVKYIGFRLEYNYAGKKYSESFYTDSDTISARSSKKVGWWQVGYRLSYSSDFKIYLTDVQYTNGDWDFFYTDNLIGYFD